LKSTETSTLIAGALVDGRFQQFRLVEEH